MRNIAKALRLCGISLVVFLIVIELHWHGDEEVIDALGGYIVNVRRPLSPSSADGNNASNPE